MKPANILLELFTWVLEDGSWSSDEKELNLIRQMKFEIESGKEVKFV